MADNNSPIDVKTSVFQRKMIKDLNANFQGLDTWSHARNMVVHTADGNLLIASNEPSTKLCYEFASTPLSQIRLKDDRLFIIQANGEFGILNQISCNYEKLFSINCPEVFNFTCKPIQGRSRLINGNEEYIVFGNDEIPIGEINLSKIPYKYTLANDECKTKQYTKEIDCEQLFQFKNIKMPCIKVKNISSRAGNLPDGSYQVAFAYLSGGAKSSDYYSLSTPVQIFNDGQNLGSIDVEISNIDRNYDEYQILLIANTSFNGTEPSVVSSESYYTYGPYSTSETSVTISDISNLRETIDQIVIDNNIPDRVGNITGNAEYLLYSDIHFSEPVNYQLQAMNIEIDYVIKQVPLDYYKNNFDFGYYGDENYSPWIRWISAKGTKSTLSHVPGRKKTSTDGAIATGDNVFENNKNLGLCEDERRIEYWETENTASLPAFKNNPFSCNERILATGSMGYFESTELYPDNTQLYGKDSCTPIRYPKFPDECKVPRFEEIDGKMYINLKLWQFKNIEHPKDKNGNYRTDIIGYEILRKTRDGGNKTIRATGYLSNMRGLVDGTDNILYQNYPYNDQSPDSFHSLTDTEFKNRKEKNFNPLTQLYHNRFSFYTPDGNYGLKTSLGEELKVFTEEQGVVRGFFEETYNHPKAKLITNFVLYVSSLLGLIESFLELNGKLEKTTKITHLTKTTATDGGTINNTPGLTNSEIKDVESLFHSIKLTPDELLKLTNVQKINYYAKRILRTAAASVAFTALASQHTQIWLDIIEKLVSPRNYAYQYNSVATFKQSKNVNKRRYVNDYQYIQETNTQLKNGFIINNEKCQKTIYIETESDVPAITFDDNSNNTISGFGLCGVPTSPVTASAAMYYAASKQSNRNQYGSIESGGFVKVHTCPIAITFNKDNTYYKSPVLAGGDCIIVQTSFQTRRPIFSQDITNQNNSNDFVFNYKKYRNLAHPRFWYNNEPYELFDIISKKPSEGKLPAQRHNLDCNKNSKNAFSVKDEYMYTSVNGVVNYIVEADSNLWYRAEGDRPHYSDKNTNLSQIFRSDRLQFTEEFKLDKAFFKLEANQISAIPTSSTFDINKIVTRDRNAIIYSLPGSKNQTINNWTRFLANNYYSFDNLQFGNLVGIHPIDMDKLIFLFDKSSPYISLGVSELQLSNDTITIGDGGLFARKPRELMSTDVAYGATQSKFAFSSNQFGHFYPSASQGRLFNFTDKLDDVTRQGMHFWAKKFMPIFLKDRFSEYTEEENTICGVGYNIVFDNTYETLYISKRDYIPKLQEIIYNKEKKVFEYNGVVVNLKDTTFFKDVSWTLSYRPQNEGFISFHDWHPDQVIQLEKHFMTIKDNSIWKHNDNFDSFCNFYGKQYPWEIAPIVSYGQNINIINSFEYHLEAYHYINNGMDKYHVLKENFDKGMVYNSEQHSGILNIITKTEVTNKDIYNYPKPINNFTTDILCIKKENKYRFNGFKNTVKDRGQQSNLDKYIFKNDENGYTSSLYTQNFDTNKSSTKLRHSYHTIWLSKENSGRTQYIFKFLNSKTDASQR